MSNAPHIKLAGKCACGSTEYAVSAEPEWTGVCHCAQCKLASGSAFFSFVSVPYKAISWIRRTPASFSSSGSADRYFCDLCGTPIGMRYKNDTEFSLAWSSLDVTCRPEPQWQIFSECREKWLGKDLQLDEQSFRDSLSPTAQRFLSEKK